MLIHRDVLFKGSIYSRNSVLQRWEQTKLPSKLSAGLWNITAGLVTHVHFQFQSHNCRKGLAFNSLKVKQNRAQPMYFPASRYLRASSFSCIVFLTETINSPLALSFVL